MRGLVRRWRASIWRRKVTRQSRHAAAVAAGRGAVREQASSWKASRRVATASGAMTGELVQMDGSWHDWFEGRGPWCCLMVMIDDATGRVYARFYERETLAAAFDVFGAVRRGVRAAAGVVRGPGGHLPQRPEPTVEEELAGEGR